MNEIRIAAMTAAYAADILSWRYPAPYDYYDVTDEDLGYYLDPANGFFAARLLMLTIHFAPLRLSGARKRCSASREQ